MFGLEVLSRGIFTVLFKHHCVHFSLNRGRCIVTKHSISITDVDSAAFHISSMLPESFIYFFFIKAEDQIDNNSAETLNYTKKKPMWGPTSPSSIISILLSVQLTLIAICYHFQMIKMMIVVVVCFVVCWLPYNIIQVAQKSSTTKLTVCR